MAEGSPTAGMQVDGAELARRMVVAAEAAASAAQSTAAIVEQMKAGGGEKDWFKLLPKPGCFEPKSREQEVALWKLVVDGSPVSWDAGSHIHHRGRDN